MQATKQQLGKGKVDDQCRSSKSEKALIIEAKSRMVFFFRNGFLLSLVQSLRKMSKNKFLEIYYLSFLHTLERSSNFQIHRYISAAQCFSSLSLLSLGLAAVILLLLKLCDGFSICHLLDLCFYYGSSSRPQALCEYYNVVHTVQVCYWCRNK